MVATFVRQIRERALLLPERFYLAKHFTAQRWRQSGMDVARKEQLPAFAMADQNRLQSTTRRSMWSSHTALTAARGPNQFASGRKKMERALLLGRLTMQPPRNKLRTSFKAIGIILPVYVVAYALNSAMGGYWLHVTMKDTDGVRWQPRFGYYDKYRKSDFLGYFFAPLIAADRQLAHRTHFFADPDFFSWSKGLFLSEIHPKHRRYFTHPIPATADRSTNSLPPRPQD